MKSLIQLITGMIVISMAFVSGVNADVWYVHPDSAVNTVQAGLNAASGNDTVLVACGTYEENIVWPSMQGIDLISEYGPDCTELRAPDGPGRVITMAQGLGSPTVIDGFTITNGWAFGDTAENYGGAVYCFNSSSPTIRNNKIISNTATSRGGGIYCAENSAPHIIGNFMQNNGTSGGGGAIACYDYSDPTIEHNYFLSNNASDGGAIQCYDHCNPSIQYNHILNNSAARGGGIYRHDSYSDPGVNFNNLSNNVAYCIYSNPTSWFGEAEYNWWAHPAGPDSGCGVFGNVDFNPWLTDEVLFDVEIVSIDSPCDSVYQGSTYTPRITVRNNCNYSYPVSFFTARCEIDDYKDYVRVDSSFYPGSTIEVDFADWVVQGDIGTEYMMTVSVYYAVDKYPANDTLFKQLIVVEQTAIDDDLIIMPKDFVLHQSYPNPFNAQTTIEYALPQPSHVTIDIYDLLGRKIETLVNEEQPAGYHQITWNASNISSGIYFYKIQAGEYSQTKKMLLLK